MKVAFLKNSTLYFSYLSIVKHITLVHFHHWTLNHGMRISRIIYIDSSFDYYIGHSQYFSIPNIACHEQSCVHLLAHVCSSWKEAPLSCPCSGKWGRSAPRVLSIESLCQPITPSAGDKKGHCPERWIQSSTHTTWEQQLRTCQVDATV